MPILRLLLALTPVCVGGTTTFSDAGTGAWSSSNTSVASIGSTTGTATGISAGLVLITYALPTGCLSSTILTVNAVAAITGTAHVCSGSVTTLSDTVTGGSWSSSNTSVANIAGTGVVTGVSAGVRATAIVYTLPTGCNTSSAFTVYASPTEFNVSGGGSYCSGSRGININLSGSQAGVKYQLYDTITAGSPLLGTGAPLAFGPETRAGSYTVVGIDTLTSCATGMDDFATITITPTVTPSVSMSSAIGDTVCPNELVTFVANPVNGGTSPAYFWKYNGATTLVYASDYNALPRNGDIIEVYLVSNAICASPDTVSQSLTITVDSSYSPSIFITANPGIDIKPGEYDTLRAVVTGGGPRPTYQWSKNGTAITGATSATYTSDSLKNSDVVTCVVTGTGHCGLVSSAFVVMDVSNLGVATVTTGGHFTLFPNPNTGTFTIKGSLGTATDQEVSIEITDMIGQVVYKNKVNAQNGNVNEQILLGNNLANGMYMLNLNAGNEHDVFHFVIGQ